jgi:hypothetical protein
MSDDALIAELRAATSSMVTATAAAEAGDWTIAEQSVIDAQQRSARLLQELGRKLLTDFGTPPQPPLPIKSD